MAYRIAPSEPQPIIKGDGGKQPEYLVWVRKLPCIVTLAMPVEAAHLSTANLKYGHLGRGKGKKADDRWALPLVPEKHVDQHRRRELAFWEQHGINPYTAALVLHGMWSVHGEEVKDLATRLIVQQMIGR